MKKHILFLIIIGTLLSSCSKVKSKLPKWFGETVVEQVTKELTEKELGQPLHNAISVLSEESRVLLKRSLAENEQLLQFFKSNPRFVSTWDYLRSQFAEDAFNPSFLGNFIHANDYASYGGNRLENYIFKRLKDGSYEVMSKNENVVLATIRKGNIVEVIGDNVNNWFLQLKPLSNYKYRINGAEYEIDEFGRVAKANFNINNNSLKTTGFRDSGVNSQMRSLKDCMDGDHAGHLLADEFGGSSNMVNLVPMQGNNVNQSQYARLENIWRDAARNGKEVNVEIKLQYPLVENSGANTLGNEINPLARPAWFEIKYEIDGEAVTTVIKNAA